LRIISGSARGRKLRLFSGQHIRPTSDRVREAVFNILQNRLGSFHNIAVLDLFCGTGALSLETLSRGAERAVLVDRSSQAAKIVAANAEICGLSDRIRFLRGGVPDILPRLAPHGPFDLIFLDPPYSRDLVPPTLTGVTTNRLLKNHGIVLVEASCKDAIPETIAGLTCIDRRHYGTTFIALLSPDEAKG
jgi:16S rRNA (guanine(966)-N(2))-methyltransferase RsmD